MDKSTKKRENIIDSSSQKREKDSMKRKIYNELLAWKQERKGKTAILIDGARRIGKSYIVEEFARREYQSYILVDFNNADPNLIEIFDKYLTHLDLFFSYLSLYFNVKLHERNSLIIFDEVQLYPKARAAIKYLVKDGRYDYIETGSLVSINRNVKEIIIPSEEHRINMYPMDFEEFLWAKGYSTGRVEDLYTHMKTLTPFSRVELDVLFDVFRDYMILGGMPAVVNAYVVNKNFSGTLKLQQQLLLDYEEDITKYAQGLDKGKIKNIYSHISIFLGQENKKFQITKVARGARSRDYVGTIDWLSDAGIVNVCYCLDRLELPLKGNYNPKLFKLYYRDTGLLIASLDEESQEDLRANRNFNTYKGAIYENIVGDMLVKQGYDLYFYRDEKSTFEMDFFVRDKHSLVPVEVKATDNATKSLNKLLDNKKKYKDISYGIKLGYKNIGYNGRFYTFPYFLTFLLRRFLREEK